MILNTLQAQILTTAIESAYEGKKDIELNESFKLIIFNLNTSYESPFIFSNMESKASFKFCFCENVLDIKGTEMNNSLKGTIGVLY